MSYETKVILTLLSQQIAKSKTIKEAYTAIVRAANVEGVALPDYDTYMKELKEQEAN